MDASAKEARFGSVKKTPTKVGDFSPTAAPGNKYRMTWKPPDSWSASIPDNGLEVTFYVRELTNGARLFHFRDERPFEEHATPVGVTALALKNQFSEWDRDFRYLMFMLYGYSRGMREHFRRRFKTAGDLIVRRSGRGGEIPATVLPVDLGLDQQGGGQQWTVDNLLEKGRACARECDQSPITQQDAISYGLYAAARRNPLYEDDPDRISALLRMALFNMDASSKVKESELEAIAQSLQRAFHDQDEKTAEEFEKWMTGGHSNFLKSIASRTVLGDKQLSLEMVRHGVLELGWRSFAFVAECLHEFANLFVNAVSPPMTAWEETRFRSIYDRQPYLGNLALIMVKERLELMRPVLSFIWDDPENKCHHAALHRLLTYYGQMAPIRRTADRRFKMGDSRLEIVDSNIVANQAGSQAKEVSSPAREQLHDIVRTMLGRRGIACPHCSSPLTIEWIAQIESEVEFAYQCLRHEFKGTLCTTIEEIEKGG